MLVGVKHISIFCFQVTDKDETENGVSAVSGGLYKYLAIVCKVMWPAISSKGSLYSFVIFFICTSLSPTCPPPLLHLLPHLSYSSHFSIHQLTYPITDILLILIYSLWHFPIFQLNHLHHSIISIPICTCNVLIQPVKREA